MPQQSTALTLGQCRPMFFSKGSACPGSIGDEKLFLGSCVEGQGQALTLRNLCTLFPFKTKTSYINLYGVSVSSISHWLLPPPQRIMKVYIAGKLAAQLGLLRSTALEMSSKRTGSEELLIFWDQISRIRFIIWISVSPLFT